MYHVQSVLAMLNNQYTCQQNILCYPGLTNYLEQNLFAYTDKMTPYHCDEIMFLAAGSVTITEEDGREETFVAGDCFFMPKGWSGYWKQSDDLKKFQMTVCWS